MNHTKTCSICRYLIHWERNLYVCRKKKTAFTASVIDKRTTCKEFMERERSILRR